MEAVNSFVMSWWPVFAGIFAVLVLLAQLWNSALRGEMASLHERANAQDLRLEKLEKEHYRFQLHATERFVTYAEIDRVVSSINSLKDEIERWLIRVETRLDQKQDK